MTEAIAKNYSAMTDEELIAELQSRDTEMEALKKAPKKSGGQSRSTITSARITNMNNALAVALGTDPELDIHTATDEKFNELLKDKGFQKFIPTGEVAGIIRTPAFRHETMPAGRTAVQTSAGYFGVIDGFVANPDGTYTLDTMRADSDAKGGGNVKVLAYWTQEINENKDSFNVRLAAYRVKKHGEAQSTIGVTDKQAEAAGIEKPTPKTSTAPATAPAPAPAPATATPAPAPAPATATPAPAPAASPSAPAAARPAPARPAAALLAPASKVSGKGTSKPNS